MTKFDSAKMEKPVVALVVIAAMLVYLADIFLLVLCLKWVSGRYSRMFMGS